MRFMYLKNVTIACLSVSIIFSMGCSPRKKFYIISGHDHSILNPLIEEYEKKQGINIVIHYKNPVDIMQEMRKNDTIYDAVWPASKMWILMGDNKHKVKHAVSIMKSPVIFGVKKSIAQKLGFIGKEVNTVDILEAVKKRKLKFLMASASHTSSGAGAYFSFLQALKGSKSPVGLNDLYRADVRNNIKILLGAVKRSSASSRWLADLFITGNFETMVNYESNIIAANRELIGKGKEPVYMVYPSEGSVIADSPLGYIDKGNKAREKYFLKFQKYLLSENVQKEIVKLGKRAAINISYNEEDRKIFNREWGIDIDKPLNNVVLPSANIIEKALHLYQAQLKKPSFTIYCLDFSGSMIGEREKEMKNAVDQILDQEKAKEYFLEAGAQDVITILPFNNKIIDSWTAYGNNPVSIEKLRVKLNSQMPLGGGDIYKPLIRALEITKGVDRNKYLTAIIVINDDRTTEGLSQDDLAKSWGRIKVDTPIFPIFYHLASEFQLEKIASITMGKVIDGQNDLNEAFIESKGYN